MQLIQDNGMPRASMNYMIRMKPNGFLSSISKFTNFSFDGVARKSSISCMFEKNFLKNSLGYWDSVRFGADSEMISRAEKLLGSEFMCFKNIGMICLDLETSLTNDSKFGIKANNGTMSRARKDYKDSWSKWHSEVDRPEDLYVEFPLLNRRVGVNDDVEVKKK